MRPAARVFIDFGYTDAEGFQLYNPSEYISDPTTFNEKIYGTYNSSTGKYEGGQIQDSHYGMQFIQGQVTSFNATIDPATGAYKCDLSVSSKNMQL